MISIRNIVDLLKIDRKATLGLLGTSNSMAYRIHEIEKHFHGNEYWFGAAASASGETHVADEMGPSIGPFALTTGNNAYGSWVQLLGSSDTPVQAAFAYFDPHRFMVTTTDSTSAFHVQIICGESANFATKLVNKEYSGFGYISATNNADSGISDVMKGRQSSGTKVWGRAICPGENAKVINFYFGIHEYIG